MYIATRCRLIETSDINWDELIDFDEFKGFITNFIPNISEEKMRAMFNQLDSNGDGIISYAEFLDDDNLSTLICRILFRSLSLMISLSIYASMVIL